MLTDLGLLKKTKKVDFTATATPKIYKITGISVPCLITKTDKEQLVMLSIFDLII